MPIQIDLGGSSSTPSPHTQNKGPAVGIDLGTTNSLVAFADEKASVKVFADEAGRALLPSALFLSKDGQKVGYEALREREAHPREVLFSIKRLMGRSYAELAGELKQIPFELADDGLHSQVQIQVVGRRVSPVEVSAEILKSLKARAEKALGQKVDRAVITVPAYFDDAQRSATKAAGRLAGLEVLRVLNEPTAAALAYGWSQEKPGRVAVYDLGGGTFDISILRIEEKVFEVLSTAGDTHLGGDDFDRALADWALEQSPGEKDPHHYARLLVEAEKAKIALGSASSARILGLEIDRATAEKLWTPLIERSLTACARALSDARLSSSDLDDVLLVGGSTRMPVVQAAVEKFFHRKPNTALNPDEAVARGAALQARSLSQAGAGAEHLLMDIIPLSLGIETLGGAVSKLLPRNSNIPAEAREVYTNHSEKQTAFDIHVLQGERELAKDCRSLARFRLRGLSPAPAGFHRIEVLFRIDANGILNVRARDLRTGKSHEIEVRPSFGISEDELFKMLEASEAHAESDMAARQLADARVEADTVVRSTEVALKNAGHLIAPEEVSEIKARLTDLRNAASGGSLEQLRACQETLNEATRELAELQVNQALQEALAGQKAD